MLVRVVGPQSVKGKHVDLQNLVIQKLRRDYAIPGEIIQIR
jgi:hypothetical protein